MDLLNLDDASLIKYCIDNPSNVICRDENFWKTRLFKKYGITDDIKLSDKTWRNFYLSIVKILDETGNIDDAIEVAFRNQDFELVEFLRRINSDPGIDLSGMNLSIKPGDDFYSYANGKWNLKNEIPEDKVAISTYEILRTTNEKRVINIIDDVVNNKVENNKIKSVDTDKIKNAYESFMNEELIEKMDYLPIKPYMHEILQVKTHDEIATLMGQHRVKHFATIYFLNIFVDSEDPTSYSIKIYSPSLGLPNRDYYLDAKFNDQKLAYKKYIVQMLSFVLTNTNEELLNTATEIIKLETQIAEATWTIAQLRNPDKQYNPMSLDELYKLVPQFNWTSYFIGAGLNLNNKFIVTTLDSFQRYGEIFANADIEILKMWQLFFLIDNSSPYLSKRFVDENFQFHGKLLTGQSKQPARWKKSVSYLNEVLGKAIGRIYVEKYFSAKGKEEAKKMVANIFSAFDIRLRKLEWMSEKTKHKALLKLSKMTAKVGYPDKWNEYDYVIKNDDLYGNVLRYSAFIWQDSILKLKQKVDKDDWGFGTSNNPQTVNAFYVALHNEIIVPAGILQKPFFDPYVDPAANYGAIGAVIGHEITHGFDDKGSKYNGDGKLENWWTVEDREKFSQRIKVLGDQFSKYEPLPGIFINSQLTMGENIADLGGILVALDAYRKREGERKHDIIVGFTGEQRVFLAWAQYRRGKRRPEFLAQFLIKDIHSPHNYRINGIVKNIDEWYKIFNVTEDNLLFIPPSERAHIW